MGDYTMTEEQSNDTSVVVLERRTDPTKDGLVIRVGNGKDDNGKTLYELMRIDFPEGDETVVDFCERINYGFERAAFESYILDQRAKKTDEDKKTKPEPAQVNARLMADDMRAIKDADMDLNKAYSAMEALMITEGLASATKYPGTETAVVQAESSLAEGRKRLFLKE